MKLSSYYQQIYQLTRAALIVRYRRTYLGLLWVLLNPIFMLLVQSFIFSRILNVSVDSYFLYLVSGLLPWLFISQSLEMGAPQLKTHALTIKSFSVAPGLFSLSLILENSVNLFIAALVTLLPLYLYYNKPLYFVLFWFLTVLPLAIGIFSVVFTLSTLNVLYKDLRYIISFLISISYFLTPVFYTREAIPSNYQWLIDYNPLYVFISPFQIFSLNADLSLWGYQYLRALALSLTLLLAAYLHWKRFKNIFFLNL